MKMKNSLSRRALRSQLIHLCIIWTAIYNDIALLVKKGNQLCIFVNLGLVFYNDFQVLRNCLVKDLLIIYVSICCLLAIFYFIFVNTKSFIILTLTFTFFR